jgi:hypothetical protein
LDFLPGKETVGVNRNITDGEIRMMRGIRHEDRPAQVQYSESCGQQEPAGVFAALGVARRPPVLPDASFVPADYEALGESTRIHVVTL